MPAPGPTPDSLEKQQRIREVLRTEGWGPPVQKRLCEEWGIAPRTLRKHRLNALRAIKAELDEERAEGLEAAAFLQDVERHIDTAEGQSGRSGMGPVAALMRVKQTVLGVERAPAPAESVDPGEVLDLVAQLVTSDEDAWAEFAAKVEGLGFRVTLEESG